MAKPSKMTEVVDEICVLLGTLAYGIDRLDQEVRRAVRRKDKEAFLAGMAIVRT